MSNAWNGHFLDFIFRKLLKYSHRNLSDAYNNYIISDKVEKEINNLISIILLQ